MGTIRRRVLTAIVLSLLSAAPVSTAPAYAVVVGGPAPHQAPRPTTATSGLTHVTTPETYIVVAGDTLSAVGARLHRSVPQLGAFNHLSDPNLILVGQVLKIPPSSYRPVGYGNPGSRPVALTTANKIATSYNASTRSVAVQVTDVWGCIAGLESTGVRYRINPSVNTGNGFYGAFQFTLQSWRGAGGGPGLPSSYSYAQQLSVAERLQQIQGWGAWPNTAPRCGV